MNRKRVWMWGAGLLCVVGIFVVAALSGRSRQSVPISQEMMKVPKPEELGVVLPLQKVPPRAPPEETHRPSSQDGASRYGASPHEVRRLKEEGAMVY